MKPSHMIGFGLGGITGLIGMLATLTGDAPLFFLFVALVMFTVAGWSIYALWNLYQFWKLEEAMNKPLPRDTERGNKL